MPAHLNLKILKTLKKFKCFDFSKTSGLAYLFGPFKI